MSYVAVEEWTTKPGTFVASTVVSQKSFVAGQSVSGGVLTTRRAIFVVVEHRFSALKMILSYLSQVAGNLNGTFLKNS